MALDLTLLTPAQLDKFIHTQSLIARQKLEAAKVRALRDYYDGVMPVLLTQRQEEFIGKMLTKGEFEFSHNTIKSVVDTLRERLSVSGFKVNGMAIDGDSEAEDTPERQVSALFWAWWEENRFDAQQIRLHRRTIRDGKSYVMVDYDVINQRPRFTLHPVDDGKTGIQYHRDPENPENVLFVNKYFYTFNPLEPGRTGDERKTTYLPHEIRKYQRGAGQTGWQPVQDPGDIGWPIPWRDSQGNPLGIPVIEFENPGGSEVAQIMGLQNALNKSWLDLIAAADAAGFPIMVTEYEDGSAVAPAKDDDDIEGDDEFHIAPGRMLEVFGAKVHRIEGSDLSQLIDVVHLIVETIAGISRTPQYYMRPIGGNDVPSGESLKQLDSGLVKRAEERQLIFGQAWADVMALAYRVQQTFGPSRLPDIPMLKVHTMWQDAETRNEKSEAETGEILKRLDVPEDEIWARLGFTPQQIQKFKAMRRTDQAATVASVAAAINAAQRNETPRTTALDVRTNGNGVQAE